MHQSIGKKKKVAIYLIFLLLLSTIVGKFSNQEKKLLFKVNKVEVSGLSNNKNLEIQNDLSSIFDRNIFIIEKEEINKIINKHNIIETFSVKKVYPSTLIVEIKPTKFLATVIDGNQLIVGSNGKLILIELNSKILPYIYGEFNSKEFLKFKQSIKNSKFKFTDFKKIYSFPSNRWDILTMDDILIKLPQSNISESLNMAYKVITSMQFKNKNIIDLRVKSYLIVK
jgi:cell division protein FtsQ